MAHETIRKPQSGYLWLFIGILFIAVAIVSLVYGIRTVNLQWLVGVVGGALLGILVLVGLFIVNPNDSRVLVLFGRYKGTVKDNGFCWANPFY